MSHCAPQRLQHIHTHSNVEGGKINKSDATSQMSQINSPHSFMQTTLTHSDYVRPGCDCQSISVSQYLPGVIRVDGVINKGKLQVCKQPPPSGSSHPC